MAEELCSGCGAVAPHHPVVGVTRDEDGRMASFPICDACWRDPSHRTVPLKMHFFDPTQAETAVANAEANILVDPAP
jgi:hypothetical protein